MAIAFDSSASNSLEDGTSLTWSHTNTGSNLGLCVTVATGTAITSVKYNGVSMTESVNSSNLSYIFTLENPATGTNTVEVILAVTGDVSGGSLSFTGVSQSNMVGNTQTSTLGSGTSLSLSLTIDTVDNFSVESQFHFNGNATTQDNGQTETSDTLFESSTRRHASAYKQHSSTGGQTLGFSWSGSVGARGAALEVVPAVPVVFIPKVMIY